MDSINANSVPPSNSEAVRHLAPSTSSSVTLPRLSLWHFSTRQWLFIGMLFLSDLFTSTSFSCIVPFFPTEAKKKGLSTAEVGLIIGIFQLTMFCASPALGKMISRVGSCRMLISGLTVCSIGSVLYGFLKFLPTSSSFFIVALLVRCLTALGSAAFRASSMTMVAQLFPDFVSSVMGTHQTVLCIGYIIGPTIGSALYELGGFSLPFFMLGSFMLLSALLSALFTAFWDINSEKEKETKYIPTERTNLLAERRRLSNVRTAVGLGTVLRVAELRLMLLTVFVLELTLFFYDSSLTDHIASLSSRPPMLAGLMLSLAALLAMLTGPCFGVLIDIFPQLSPVLLILGSLLGLIFPLLMGPSPLFRPFLPFSVPMVSIAFALQGLAISAINTPSFKFCIDAARRNGLGVTDSDTCGCISGLLNAAVSLGGFIGVTVGALSIQWVGFEWTGTFAGFFHLFPFVAQIYCSFMRKKERSSDFE